MPDLGGDQRANESYHREHEESEQTHVLQFTADNESDIGRYIKAAGDTFRMDYPNVPFDDKIIRLESAYLKTSKSENGDVSSGFKPT